MGKQLTRTLLNTEYPNRGKRTRYDVLSLRPLLQKNYGEKNDCTITSLACIFGEGHYAEIEKIAKKYGYDGKKKGTNPLTVKAIMKDFLRKWKMLSPKPFSAYGKGAGWTFNLITQLIKNRIPVVLNLWDDGRGYYHDHSVVIVGIEEYERAKFLLVYDNWNSSISYIDYGKLCFISSINWAQ